MDSKNKNASEKPDKVVYKQKQTDQQSPKVKLRANQPLQPTQQCKYILTPNGNVVFNLCARNIQGFTLFRKGVNPCIFLAHILWAGNIQ